MGESLLSAGPGEYISRTFFTLVFTLFFRLDISLRRCPKVWI